MVWNKMNNDLYKTATELQQNNLRMKINDSKDSAFWSDKRLVTLVVVSCA